MAEARTRGRNISMEGHAVNDTRAPKGRRLSLLLALSLALGASACADKNADKKVGHDATDPTPAVQVDPAALEMAQAAGGQAAFVIYVWPDRWRAFHQKLAQIADQLPPMVRRAFTDFQDPGPLLSYAVHPRVPIDLQALSALDPTRPAVIALGEPPLEGLPGFVASQPMSAVTAGLRRRVLLPAKDAAALLKALRPSLDAAAGGAGRDVEGVPHWVIDERHWIAAKAQAGYVEVISQPSGVRGWVAREVAGSVYSPATAAPPLNPALAHALNESTPASLLVRPRRFRAMAAWEGMFMAHQALYEASGPSLPALEAMGRALVLLSEIVITDEGADFQAHSVALDLGEGGLAVEAISALTEAGAARWSSDPWAGPTVKGSALATVSAQINLAKALQTATLPQALQGTDGPPKPRQLAELIQDCGWGCSAYLTLQRPSALMALLGRMVPQSATVRGATLAVMPPEGQTPEEKAPEEKAPDGQRPEATAPRVAAAIEVTEAGVAQIKGWLEALGGPAQVSAVQRGDRHWVLIGLNAAPETIFDLEKASPRPFIDMYVDIQAPGPESGEVSMFDQARRRAQEVGLTGVGFTSRRLGRILESRIYTGPRRPTVAVAPEVVALADMRWSAAQASPVSEAVATCLVRAGKSVSGGLQAMSHAAPDQRDMLIMKAFEEARAATPCVARNPDAAAVVEALEGALLNPRLSQARDEMRYLTLSTLLQAACPDDGAPKWCAPWRATLAALPPGVAQATVKRCQEVSDMSGPSIRLIVSDKGAILNERPTALKALPGALAALNQPHPTLKAAPAAARLLVLPGAPDDTLSAALGALKAAEIVEISVSTTGGVCPSLPEAAPTAIPGPIPGPAPAPAPRPGDLTQPSGSIKSVIYAHYPDFKRCYEAQLMRQPKLAGRVKLSLTLAPSGDVVEATASGMESIDACLKKVGEGLKFAPAPAGEGVRKIVYPLIFSPG